MPGKTKITPSAPTPKFRSHSCTAFSALILGSDVSLLSIYSKSRVKTEHGYFVRKSEAERGLTKTKSFPRPWYLAKWRKPDSLRLRKEADEVLTAVSVLMEDTTRRELGYLKVRCGVGKVDRVERGERLLTEARVRRLGDVKGTEMVAVMAIAVASNGGGNSTLPVSPSRAAKPLLNKGFGLSTVSVSG